MRHLLAALLLGLLAVPVGAQSSRDFDGVDDYVDCGDIAALDGIDNLTCGCWAHLDDVDAVAGGIISKRDGSTATWILRKTATEEAQWFVNAGNAQATGATVFNAGVWNFFVGTYDRSLPSSRAKVYLNGVQDGAANGTDSQITATAHIVEIGRQSSLEWDGQIAHCFCEPRTWTAVEIAEAYRGSLAQIQRAAATGGHWPGWDPEASPVTYRGQGVFAACTASAPPAVSSDGPPVFLPGGGQ